MYQTRPSKDEIVLRRYGSLYDKAEVVVMVEKLAIHGGPKAVKIDLLENLKLRPGWPIIGEEEIQEVVEAMRRVDITAAGGGGVMQEWEECFGKYLGAEYVITTNSCCAALHICLGACGVGPGDEVITTPYTWGQTVAPILQQNAIPVFADIDPKTYTLDPNKIEEQIRPQTKAVVVCHIYGHPADMDSIMSIAEDYDLKVIEDCAQAIGASYKARKVGTLGHMGAFSIGDGKNMVGGEGGMITTNDEELYERALLVGMHPSRSSREIKNPKLRRWIDSVTIPTYRIHPLACAIAKIQLRHLDDWNSSRNKNAEYFSKGLKKLQGIDPVYVAPNCFHVYHIYSPSYVGEELNQFAREKYVEALRAEGVSIGTYVGTPIHLRRQMQQHYYQGRGCPWSCRFAVREVNYRKGDCPVAEDRCEKRELNVGSINWYDKEMKIIVDMYLEAFGKVTEQVDKLR